MHILYLHQYFVTRHGFTGTRSYEFSRRLIARGHRVTMIKSGLHAVDGLDCPPDRTCAEYQVDGIRVIAIAAGYANSHYGTGMSGARRVLEFMKFARLATKVGAQLDRPDVVYATSTPLMIGLAGRDLGRRFDAPFVFEVRDVWPQALINTGTLRNPLAIWWLRRMERGLYRAAEHIVALSPGMRQGVMAAGAAADKVTVITNSSDLDLFRPDLDGSAQRQRLGLGDRFAAIYFGAMGRANGLDYCVEAARILRDRGRNDIAIVLHGSGGMEDTLRATAREYGLSNVVFSRSVPDKQAVAEMVAACNAGLTIYAATETEQSWSPNKMFDTLAAGRPVLINVPGWLRETIEGGGAGLFADPKRPEALADALIRLADDAELCREMGQRARRLAESTFSRDALADRLADVLVRAVERYRGRRGGAGG